MCCWSFQLYDYRFLFTGFGVSECNLKTYPSRWHHNDIHIAETSVTSSIWTVDNWQVALQQYDRLKNCASFLVPQLCIEWDTRSAQNYAINLSLSLTVLFHPPGLFPVLTSPNSSLQPHPFISSITSQFLSLLSHPDSVSQFHWFMFISVSLMTPSKIALNFHFLGNPFII